LNALRILTDRITGKAPPGARRASGWPKFRKAFISNHPECLICGREKKVEAHHIVPFHLAPDLELDPENLLALCRRCHLFVGHLGAWERFNPSARADSYYWRARFEQ